MTTRLSGRLVNDNTVSPLDFGAVGDGTTDDTAAVQRAIDHLETTSGAKILDLNNKSYLITYQLTLNAGGIRIQGGKFIWTPNTANRGKVMLKISVAQADTTEYDLKTNSVLDAGDSIVETKGTTFSGANGSYIFLKDSGWDYVYKSVNAKPEDQFPRSDRAFKGDLLKIDWSEDVGTTDRKLYLENAVSTRYAQDTSLPEVDFLALTMLEDITFDGVDIQGPGIVRKKLVSGGIQITAGARVFNYGATDHNLTTREYFSVDTGDLTSPLNFKYTQGIFKPTADPTGLTEITCGALSNRNSEAHGQNGSYPMSVIDAHSLDTSINETCDTSAQAQPWIYLRSEIGISAEHVVNLKMINCNIKGCGEAGVVTMKCWEPEFSNCTFEGARLDGSGGLVIGNGCYRPFIHNCEFTGYNGLTLGSTRMKVLIDHVDLATADLGHTGFSFMGGVNEAKISNNIFRVKQNGVTIRENAFNTEVIDNSFNLKPTFEAERYGIANSNRLLSRGIQSNGVGVTFVRNEIRGTMETGIYHRQNQKASYVNQEYLEGGSASSDLDIGDQLSLNMLLHRTATDAQDAGSDSTAYGNRDIGNETTRFYVDIRDNKIQATYNTVSSDISALSSLYRTSRYGIFIENQTAGRTDNKTSWGTKVTISSNKISGQLANIRMNLINGKFKGVQITNNILEANAYLNPNAGGSGNTNGDNRGLDGFYNDRHLGTDGSELTSPTYRDGTAKGSGLCLMIQTFEEYGTSMIAQPSYEDVDVSNNIFGRSQKLQDSVPDSGWDDSDGGNWALGGASHFSVYFDCGVAASLRHVSVSDNRFHYGGRHIISWMTYRSPWANDTDSITLGDHVGMAFVHLRNNVGNLNQTEGRSGTTLTHTTRTGQEGVVALWRNYRFSNDGTTWKYSINRHATGVGDTDTLDVQGDRYGDLLHKYNSNYVNNITKF